MDRPASVPVASRRSTWLAAATLAGLAIAAWANALRTPFVFDDDVAIVGNESIRRLWPPWMPLWAPARRVMAGRPLPNLTLAINYALGGLDPWGYHAVNVALHVAAGLALFGIVRRTLPRAGLPAAIVGAASALALAVAAVWLVHPLQTDAVTYVTQRTEVLMGLCYLVTLYAAIRAWDAPRPWTVVAIIACALGMTSKEVMVSAPAMVLVYDWVFFAPFAETWRRRRGLYAGLAATWLVLGALLVFTPRTDTIGFDAGIGPWEYLTTQAGVLTQYLRLALWPDALCIDHGVWVAHGWREIVLPGALVVALVAATVWALARRRPGGFLGAWFFGILAPTSSVVPIVTEVMAERRLYLPLAAVVMLVVIGGAVAMHRLFARRWRAVGVACATVLVATLALATVARNRVYASEETILADVVRKRPDNYRARNNLASVLIDAGRRDEARAQLLAAIRLEPRFALPYYNLGTLLLDEDRPDEAAVQLEHALRLDPENAQARVNLGTALVDLDRLDEAALQYAAAARLDPSLAEARHNLGMILLHQGDAAAAEAQLKRAVRLAPARADFRQNLLRARAQARTAGG